MNRFSRSKLNGTTLCREYRGWNDFRLNCIQSILFYHDVIFYRLNWKTFVTDETEKKQAFVIGQTETENFRNWWNWKRKTFVIDASQGESSALRGKFIGQLPWKPNPQKPPRINNRLKIPKSHFGFYDFHQTRFLKLLAFMSSIRPIFWSRPLASSVLLFFQPTARARNRQRIVCRNELLGQEPHPSSQIYIGDCPRKKGVPDERYLDFVALKTHSSALLLQIPDHRSRI